MGVAVRGFSRTGASLSAGALREGWLPQASIPDPSRLGGRQAPRDFPAPLTGLRLVRERRIHEPAAPEETRRRTRFGDLDAAAVAATYDPFRKDAHGIAALRDAA